MRQLNFDKTQPYFSDYLINSWPVKLLTKKTTAFISFLLSVLVYGLIEYNKLGWSSNWCFLIFIPSLIYLHRLIYKNIDKKAWFTRGIFILGQFSILLIVALCVNLELAWVDFFTNYYLIFIFLQLIVYLFRLFKSIFLWPPANLFFKKYAIFVLFSIAIGFLGWRNWQLNQRVDQLDSTITESRLFCDQKESVAEVKNSVVRIIGSSLQGTGFYIDKNQILTNYHVVFNNLRPRIVLPDYTLLQGEVIAADQSADLAIIKVDNQGIDIPPLEFGDPETLEPLDELIAVGFPLGTSIRGEATVNKGHFVAIREVDDLAEKAIQTDIVLGHGMSGGPMIDICGKVVGINQLSTAGLSMGISGKGFTENRWRNMLEAEDPVADIEKIEFKPNESPLECVKAFYNYQTTGEFKKAYNLLSTNYTDWTFDRWKEGYENTLYVVFVKAEESEEEENTVLVKFYSADLIGESLEYKFFEGTQKVEDYNGQLKLEQADIKQIDEPGWEWYYDFE